jgi:spore coat-associated protein N
MSRLAVLRRHPKRTLAGLVVALVAIGVAIGSGASFSSSSTNNPSTGFTAGLLKQTLAPSGALSFNGVIDKIKPGWGTPGGNGSAADESPSSPGYGVVTVTNSGNLNNVFTIAGSVPSHAAGSDTVACGGACSDLQGALKVKLIAQDNAGDPVSGVAYDGLVSGLSGATTLGSGSGNTFTLPPGEHRTYKAYFYLPFATGNAYQGGNATVNLSFSGAQTTSNESTGP